MLRSLMLLAALHLLVMHNITNVKVSGYEFMLNTEDRYDVNSRMMRGNGTNQKLYANYFCFPKSICFS